MAICNDCHKEMEEAESCCYNSIIVHGKVYKRNTSYYGVGERCHDCDIINKPGNIHHMGCDMERCPICGGQLISCGCIGDDVILTDS